LTARIIPIRLHASSWGRILRRTHQFVIRDRGGGQIGHLRTPDVPQQQFVAEPVRHLRDDVSVHQPVAGNRQAFADAEPGDVERAVPVP
jgi:hypothetical protein